MTPPDIAEVPPPALPRSTTTTSAPDATASSAADAPAQPKPTNSTSVSTSQRETSFSLFNLAMALFGGGIEAGAHLDRAVAHFDLLERALVARRSNLPPAADLHVLVE